MDDSDSESEYETEEAVILVELNGIIDSNFLLEEQNPAKILGVDTEKPILQIGHYIFTGEYEDTLGTVVVYQTADSSKAEASESPEANYEYLCKTDKKLSMKRVFIQEKKNENLETSEISSNITCIPNGQLNGLSEDIVVDDPVVPTKLEEVLAEAKSQVLKEDQKVGDLSEEAPENKCLVESIDPIRAAAANTVASNASVPQTTEHRSNSKDRKQSGKDTLPKHKDSAKRTNAGGQNKQKQKVPRKIQKRKHEGADNDKNTSPSTSTRNDQLLASGSKFKQKKMRAVESEAQVEDVANSMECSSEISEVITSVQEDVAEKNLETPGSSEFSENISSSSAKIVPSTSRGLASVNNIEEPIPKENEPSLSSATDGGASNNATALDDENASTNEVNIEGADQDYCADESDLPLNLDANQLVESSTDKMLGTIPSPQSELKGDDNCSSSGDTQTRSIPHPQVTDVCQSSDNKSDTIPPIQKGEKTDNDASSSSQVTLKDSDLDITETIPNPESNETSSETNNPGCEVSQSLKEDNESSIKYDSDMKDNECEAYSSVNTLYGSLNTESVEDSSNARSVETSDENQMAEGSAATACTVRKLSSCEVSQSNNSETEFLKNKDTMSECEVFVESALPGMEDLLPGFYNALESSDVGSNEVEYPRYSQTSEGSTSEISQSHRSVIQEVTCAEEVPRYSGNAGGEVCSQSSDKSNENSSAVSSETKDMCVSSCDISHHSSVDEPSFEEKRHLKYLSCEVSQSDESDENCMVATHSKSSRNEAEISNECDGLNSVSQERKDFANEPSESGPSHSGQEEAVMDHSTQNSCEVTQSFCSEKNDSGQNLTMEDKTGSNECGVYEEGAPTIQVLEDTPKESCVSSDDVGNFSSPMSLDLEKDSVEKDPRCEVSQSFRPVENNAAVEESCASSDAGSKFEDQEHSLIDESESQNFGEVSQSLKVERPLPSDSDDDGNVSECNRDELPAASEKSPSNVSVKEVCESSDDITACISNEETNSELREEQPATQSVCEVSQSYRLEESGLVPQAEQSIDMEIESSNECEVAGSMSAILKTNPENYQQNEKNVCESSDDIDNISESQNESPKLMKDTVFQGVCQSSKSDESMQLQAGTSGGDLSDPNDSPNESIGVCESSEDIKVGDPAILKTDSDACTSSDKSFKVPEVKDQIFDDKVCDSFSRQKHISDLSTNTSMNEEDNNRISQSETDSTSSEVYVMAPNSSEQSANVVVSSSVDIISSNYIDVIYSSSSVSNSTLSTNVEVSQSSAYSSPCVSSNVNIYPSGSSISKHPVRGEASNEVELHPANEEHRSPIGTSHDVSYSPEEIADAPQSDVQITSNSNNNSLVESSTLNSSLLKEGQRMKGQCSSKDSSEDAGFIENRSGKEASTSQAFYPKERKRESVISDSRESGSTSNQTFSSDSTHRNLSERELLLERIARYGNADASSRPSLLEVIVSSASDFRNSLMYDTNSFKDRNQVSSITESSSSRIESASCSYERTDVNTALTPSESMSSFQPQHYESTDTEVTGSLEPDAPNESNSNLYRVSQSSDIVNTHSSTSNIQTQFSDGISDSSQRDFVQSSCASSKALPFAAPTDSSDASEQVSSAEENANLSGPKVSDSGEVSESSSAQIVMPTCSGNSVFSSESNVQVIESSNDLPTFHEGNASSFNIESEVSSTPSDLQNPHLNVLSADGSEQCSVVEGNVMLLSVTDDSPDRSYESSNINVSSANSDSRLFPSGDEVTEISNEAETLNRSSTSSPPPRQLDPNEQVPLSSVDITVESIETNASDSPSSVLEVVSEIYDCDGSSEVSESLAAEQSDITQSSLTDSKVSCSAVEFTLNDQTLHKNYSFNDGEFPNLSREAESKSSDDCISSYGHVCDDTVLPSQNLPSSANSELSMYSYEGEYDDSIQSSSLEATQLSINEQIKAIASPPNFSNSSNSEGQIPLSSDPCVPLVSESQSLSPVASVPNMDKITSSFPIKEIPHEHLKETSGISSSEDSSNGLEISDLSSQPQHLSYSKAGNASSKTVSETGTSLCESPEKPDSLIEDLSLQPKDTEPVELEVSEADHLDTEKTDLVDTSNEQSDNCDKNG